MLMLLCFLPLSECVCTTCFGLGVGCSGVTANCPWKTGSATNAAVVLAGTGSLVVASLFPPKILRLFPRSVLDTIIELVSRPKAGQSFDMVGKTNAQIRAAVLAGHLDKAEAILHLASMIEDLDLTQDTAEVTMKQLQVGIDSLKLLQPRVSTSSSMDSALLFVLSTLSKHFCETPKMSFCIEISEDGPEKSETDVKGLTGSLKSTLTRPRSSEQMYSLLNSFALVACNTGLTNSLAILPFLEDCIYDPVRAGVLPWFVAFELMILYLKLVEEHPSIYGLANVISASGGLDAKRKEARISATSNYPRAFFRTPGGNPGTSGIEEDSPLNNTNKVVVTSFDQNATRCCTAWNKGIEHLQRNVVNGKCKYYHGCEQFVSDKGPGGQCRSTAHKRKDCDYDESKKLSKALKQ